MIKRYVCAVMRGRIYLFIYVLEFATETITVRVAFGYEMHNFAQIVFYFCYILLKNAKKCKKMQKNLHISKKSCTFAPSNEKDTEKNTKK